MTYLEGLEVSHIPFISILLHNTSDESIDETVDISQNKIEERKVSAIM